MSEYRRLWLGGRFGLLLLLALLLNAFLFLRTQEREYGTVAGYAGASSQELQEEVGRQFAVYGQRPYADGLAACRAFSESEKAGGDWTLPVYAAEEYVLPYLNYLAEYPSYLARVQENAKVIASLPVFGGDPHSFSSRNIVKTAADYAVLPADAAENAAPFAVEAVLEYHTADVLALLLMLFFALLTLEERKKGLWNLVWTTRFGRGRLAVSRLVSWIAASFLVCAVLYGSTWLLACRYFGTPDLDAGAQSVMSLKQLVLPVTVKGFLLRFAAVKTAGLMLIGLLFWLLMTAASDMAAGMALVGAAAAAEYALFAFLPVQSVFNLFKYGNLMSFLFAEQIYRTYLNYNLFGYPVNNRELLEAVLPVLLVLCAAAEGWLMARKRPEGTGGLMRRLADLWQRAADRTFGRLTGAAAEWGKALFSQGGWWMLPLYVFLVLQIYPVWEKHPMSAESTQDHYLAVFEGPLTEESRQGIADERAAIEAEYAAFEELSAGHDAGTVSEYEYAVALRLLDTTRAKSEALSAVEEMEERALAKEAESGYRAWLFNGRWLEWWYEDTPLSRAQGLLGLLFMALTAGTALAEEAESGMRASLRGSRRGRLRFILRRQGILAAAALFSAAVLYGAEYLFLTKGLVTAGWDAPAQMEGLFRACTWPVTVRGLTLVVFSLQTMVLWSAGQLALFLSGCFGKKRSAAVVSAAALAGPSALWVAGVPLFEKISPARLMQAVPFLRYVWFDKGTVLAAYGGVFVLGAALAILGAWRWCRTPEKL